MKDITGYGEAGATGRKERGTGDGIEHVFARDVHDRDVGRRRKQTAMTTAVPPSTPRRTKPLTPRRAAATAVTAALAAFTVWAALADSTPYDVRADPAVSVRITPEKSEYPYAKELAGDTDELIRAYAQRLRAGDARDLARLGAPWYEGRYAEAVRQIERYQSAADEPVRVVVGDPVTDYLGGAVVRFADGQTQRLGLVRDEDGVWYLELGTGDPTGRIAHEWLIPR
ncbi:hypothetical protein [Streptomyces yaizuensis]|uniref:Secreted protein n=1 Tax=Streptomyces yaizuensis TaxID=2989713 RepID=A0ABQ5P772_9ACTN|nr:hypothetical protein [Streptomyces sp. YSPA8]GLF98414.1 hypothetical protein SYYSPA8_28975 [Streptomyces sp. YSPA8]